MTLHFFPSTIPDSIAEPRNAPDSFQRTLTGCYCELLKKPRTRRNEMIKEFIGGEFFKRNMESNQQRQGRLYAQDPEQKVKNLQKKKKRVARQSRIGLRSHLHTAASLEWPSPPPAARNNKVTSERACLRHKEATSEEADFVMARHELGVIERLERTGFLERSTCHKRNDF
jgi:hypothetical protein